jgi:DNA-binding LacI/PurR family transcriptional regulator
MATQQDIADRLGVSVTTVSLALRNDPQVSAEMRIQVHAAAKELGYTYRPRRNAHPQTSKIAFIGRYRATSAFYLAVLHGAERACQQHNLTLHYIQLEEAIRRSLIEDNVDAMILVSSIDLQTIGQFKRLGLPMVLVDNNLPHIGLDRVLIENADSIHRAVARLFEWGHRQIVFVRGPDDIPSFRDRARGYRAAMQSMGLEPQEALVAYNSSVDDAREQFSRWLADTGATDFTAALACNDKTAIGVIYALQNSGLRVPDDVSVIGFDDIDMAQIVRPQLTTIHVYRELLGEMGVQMLLDRIQNPSRSPMTLTIETTFIERESTRPLQDSQDR